MSKFSAIPDVTDDPRSLAPAVRAMKDIVEQLSGLRGGSASVPTLYVLPREPKQILDGRLRIRDLWIHSETNVMSWFNGEIWVTLA